MYELERSRADALTIEGLHRDIGALIQDKRQLSEENLRLRSTVAALPANKRSLAERIAGLEAQLARAKRDGVTDEERQATAFNAILRALEGEVAELTGKLTHAQAKMCAEQPNRPRLRPAAPPRPPAAPIRPPTLAQGPHGEEALEGPGAARLAAGARRDAAVRGDECRARAGAGTEVAAARRVG